MSLAKHSRWGFNKKDSDGPDNESPQPPSAPLPETEVSAGGEAALVKPKPPKAPPKVEKPVEDPYYQLKANVHRRLIEEIDLNKLKEQDSDKLKPQIKDAVNHLLMEEDTLLTASERERLCEEVVNETMGLGPLEQLLNDPSITEIMINGPHLIFVERKGKVTESPVRFKDDAHLMQLGDLIEVVVVGQDPRAALPGQLDQLGVDSVDAQGVLIRQLDRHAMILLERGKDLQPAPAAVALERIRRVGHHLQLLQDELRHDDGREDAAGTPGHHSAHEAGQDQRSAQRPEDDRRSLVTTPPRDSPESGERQPDRSQRASSPGGSSWSRRHRFWWRPTYIGPPRWISSAP